MGLVDYDPQFKYIVIHTQENICSAHGYYDREIEASEAISRITEAEEVENIQDSIDMFKVDVTEIERKYDCEIENIYIYDVAEESHLLYKLIVDESGSWKRAKEF